MNRLVTGGLMPCLIVLTACATPEPPLPPPPPPPVSPPPPPPPPPPPDERWEAAQRARAEMERQSAMHSRGERDAARLAYERERRAFARQQSGAGSPGPAATGAQGARPADSAAQGTNGGGDKIFCPAMEDVATAAECENYTLLSANAAPGIAAFGAPRTMALAQYYPVKLIVGKAERARSIEAAAGSAGEVSTAKVGLGPWVCAQLQAVDFDVRGDRKQCQRRGGSPQISFAWEVSPKREDTLRLSAVVQTLTEKNGQPLDQIDSAVIAVAVTGDSISRFDKWMERLTGSAGGLRTFLLALASALGVLSVVIWRIRTLGRKPDKDALKDLTAG